MNEADKHTKTQKIMKEKAEIYFKERHKKFFAEKRRKFRAENLDAIAHSFIVFAHNERGMTGDVTTRLKNEIRATVWDEAAAIIRDTALTGDAT